MSFEEKLKKIIKELLLNEIILSSEEIEILKDKKILQKTEEIVENKDFFLVKNEIKNYNNIKKERIKLEKLNIFLENEYFLSSKIIKPDNFIENYQRYFLWFREKFIEKYGFEKIISINKLNSKNEKKEVEIICMISSISETKNKHKVFNGNDLTGEIKVLINNNNSKLKNISEKICEEDVVYIKGKLGNKIIFLEELKYLNYSRKKEKNKIDKNLIFISDLHIGSSCFCEEKFIKFVNWVNTQKFENKKEDNGQNKNKEESKNNNPIIFVLGDIVDGVGVYKSQEKEQKIKSLKHQYEKAAELFSKINKEIKIIIIPGEHDNFNFFEPQNILNSSECKDLISLENVIVLPNPSFLKIKQENSNLKILLYHGNSFDYFLQKHTQNNEADKSAEFFIETILEKRYLGNSKLSSYNPCMLQNKIIKQIPDIFATGHIHAPNISKNKNVLFLNPGTFQDKKKILKKENEKTTNCTAVFYNTKTEKIKILKFD